MILHSALQRRSGPSVVSLLIFQNDLSSQENVTLPCQLCLRLPPPPTVSLSLSSSSSQIPLFPPLFSHLITFEILLRCYGAKSLQTFQPRSKRRHMITNHERRSETKRRPKTNSYFPLFSFQILLLQESLFRWPIVYVALESYLVSMKH